MGNTIDQNALYAYEVLLNMTHSALKNRDFVLRCVKSVARNTYSQFYASAGTISNAA